MAWRIMLAAVCMQGLSLAAAAVRVANGADEMKIPLTFSGGHDTDPQDHGRPVVLVAAGLGVKPEVFREAFRGVTPVVRWQTLTGAAAEQQRSTDEGAQAAWCEQ